MILADPRGRPTPTRIGARITLDELLRRAAARRPDALALLDPPNRDVVTGGKPRMLTYEQTDRIVSGIAGRLRRMGLHTDAVVALQMANTVESVLTLLGVLRAGLIAMPLPALWRRSEMVAALSRVGATALIVSGRIVATDHYALAMQVAAEMFPIRYVCGYGPDAPDGLVPFDNLFEAGKLDPIPAWDEERAAEPGPAAHLAVVTWDVGADGPFPVARSHAELIAGGLTVMLESGLQQDAVLLSTIMPSSAAGLATSMTAWLLTGGTLAMHHPFDPETYLKQVAAMGFDAVIVPGPLAAQLTESARSSQKPMSPMPSRYGEPPSGLDERSPGAKKARAQRTFWYSARPVCWRHAADQAESLRPFPLVPCPLRALRRPASLVPRSLRLPPARWRSAGRWCRAPPFRRARNAAAYLSSRCRRTDLSIRATRATPKTPGWC
jgi:acyl-CoA synthetase (AMP-forming)/AMP-acid ligase II